MALCTCEECARSELGTIEDKEIVGRLIFSPDHLSKRDQSIRPGAFPLSHIQHKGLSLVRLNKITDGHLSSFARAVAAEHPSRNWHGIANFPALIVRELRSGDDRAVCLFDDPTTVDGNIPKNDAHALAIAAQGDMSDEDAREVRAAIMKAQCFSPAA